eukprot:4216370-Pleurochrysis_carterae.AAC.1
MGQHSDWRDWLGTGTACASLLTASLGHAAGPWAAWGMRACGRGTPLHPAQPPSTAYSHTVRWRSRAQTARVRGARTPLARR